MNYLYYMIWGTPILVALAGGLFTWWMLENQDKVAAWKIPRYSKDPRWKNRNATVDFSFAAFTILTSIIIALMGYML